MHFQGDESGSRIPRQSIKDVLENFPGPIVLIENPAEGDIVNVGFQAVNDAPWSIDALYESPESTVISVRTVRSADGLDSQGLPVEDLASALVNLRLRTDSSAARGAAEPNHEEWAHSRVALARSIRERAGAAPVTQSTVYVDGTPLAGERLDLDDDSAVLLRWEAQTLVCAGPRQQINDLRLRTAAPEEF